MNQDDEIEGAPALRFGAFYRGVNQDGEAGGTSLFRFHALRDVLEKRPSSGKNLDALDGIRGLAVLIVLASHSEALGMRGHGGVGVWLFFSLSAFLLTLPFTRDPTRARRPGPLLHYFSRRFLRIIPAYYAVIVTTFLFARADFPFLWKHLLFLRGDGIWWTIPQEMLFYLVLPVLVALQTLAYFRGALASALRMCALAIAANFLLTSAAFSLDGNGTQLPFFFGPFAAGMAACYAYRIPALNQWVRRPSVNRLLGALGLLLLALLVFTAPDYYRAWHSNVPFFEGLRPNLGWRHPGAFGALCALFVYITLVCEGRLIHRIMSSFPLRALGIVSFGLYLIHMTVIDHLKEMGVAPGSELFLLTLAIGYALACALYELIERPCIRVRTPERWLR